jgi:hypothetical protein
MPGVSVCLFVSGLLCVTYGVTTVLMAGQLPSTVPLEPRAEDAAVLRAVLEHTIIPAVRRASSRHSGEVIALVADRSSSLCKNPQPGTPCRFPYQWRQFLEPNSRGWPGLAAGDDWFGLFDEEYRQKALADDERRRKELMESLEARNAASYPLQTISHPLVVLIPADRRPEMEELYRERTVGSSSLSLPGYSGDGYALMYGSYGYGSCCGYSWLFVLKKIDGQWVVRSATVTAAS